MMCVVHRDNQKDKKGNVEDSDKSEHRHRDIDEHTQMNHMEERMDMMQHEEAMQ